MTIHCGYETWLLSKLANKEIKEIKNVDIRHETGWFASDVLLTMGLIGTVAGFILMLAGAFHGINISDVSSVQQALANMAVGMSTALYTTLTGLITSTLLKFQYFRLQQDLERYRNDHKVRKD
jgi:flagellar motor component MotA